MFRANVPIQSPVARGFEYIWHTYAHIHIFTHTHIHTQINTLTHSHTHTFVILKTICGSLELMTPCIVFDIHTHTDTHRHTQTHTWTCTHINTLTPFSASYSTHTHTRHTCVVLKIISCSLELMTPCILFDTRKHTRTHTRTHKHTHSLSHTHIRIHTHTCVL